MSGSAVSSPVASFRCVVPYSVAFHLWVARYHSLFVLLPRAFFNAMEWTEAVSE